MGAPAVRGALARRLAPVRGHRRKTGGASPARQGWPGVPRQGGAASLCATAASRLPWSVEAAKAEP